MNDEGHRQRALLAALAGASPVADLGLRETGARAARGLEAYRANAEASADRALAAVFPTVRSLVGAEDFAHLAREFWHAHPPLRGDLGEWGDPFAPWLERHAAMRDWPYLGDCARLDHALHGAERATDAEFDAASLTLLESTDPARLRIEFMPGTALLCSRWPIARIHAAHQLDGPDADRAFERLRVAIAGPEGEQVLVARSGWRAAAYPLDAASADWAERLLAGACLADAIEQAGAGFDFAAWLAAALRHAWLKGVAVSRD
jgi:Putative DNA-binding domain